MTGEREGEALNPALVAPSPWGGTPPRSGRAEGLGGASGVESKPYQGVQHMLI